MKAYSNFVIFKTTQLFNDKAKISGVDGKELIIDTSFDPQKHVNNTGEVVSLPIHLTSRPVMQEHRGSPAPDDASPFEYKRVSDVSQDLEIGDKIVFHFNTITMRNCVKEEGVHPNKTWYFRVSYEQIICAIRNGKIIPIASYILVDPDFESWDDILVPTYSQLRNEKGEPILKPKDQWIQRKVKPEYKYLTAFVRHVGTPFRGDKCEIEVGQKIWYRRNADWMNTIEGKEYFVIRQRHITGKEVNGEFVPIRGHLLVIPESEPTQTESGVIIKKKMTRRGVVFAQGDSSFPVGTKVLFGESDRQEIKLGGSEYLLIKKGDVIATLERNAKP